MQGVAMLNFHACISLPALLVFTSVARKNVSVRMIMFSMLIDYLQSSPLCVVETWFQGGVYVQWVPLVYLILVRV